MMVHNLRHILKINKTLKALATISRQIIINHDSTDNVEN